MIKIASTRPAMKAVAAVFVALALGACTEAAPPYEESLAETIVAPQSELAQVMVPSDRAVSTPFEFTVSELGTGQEIDGLTLLANGPIIMAFVTPWCPVCVAEGPELALAAGANEDVMFAMVHSGGTADEFARYVETAGLAGANVLHLSDPDGLLWARFNVTQQPSYVIVDGGGLMRSSIGQLESHGLQRAVDLARDGIPVDG